MDSYYQSKYQCMECKLNNNSWLVHKTPSKSRECSRWARARWVELRWTTQWVAESSSRTCREFNRKWCLYMIFISRTRFFSIKIRANSRDNSARGLPDSRCKHSNRDRLRICNAESWEEISTKQLKGKYVIWIILTSTQTPQLTKKPSTRRCRRFLRIRIRSS